jgi:transcriptional antiterminator NusG
VAEEKTKASEVEEGAVRWYALQTYSGHENKVKTLIERKIGAIEEGSDEKGVVEVIVPTQEVVEIKGGKKVTKEKRLYPGYVLVKAVLDQETVYEINNVQGVIRFLGGTDVEPQPLKQDEVNKILGISEELEEAGPEEEVPFRTGQAVEIKEGPFSDFSGTVQEVFHDKGKVRVEVSLFGRPTSVELDYTQLEGF